MSWSGLPARIESKIIPEPNSGCWLWLHKPNKKGYVKAWWSNKHQSAHVVVYKLSKGKIRKGLQIDHTCKNKSCVNPDHLEAVTPRINTLRSDSVTANNARKTHCVHGHELSGEALYQYGNHRTCRMCILARCETEQKQFLRGKMRTPEKAEKDEIKRYLDSIGAWQFTPYVAGFGKSGVPDIVFCWRGRFGGIEVKREGKTPTVIQERRMKEIVDAGGIALWGTADRVIPLLKGMVVGFG